jgi:XTP/dITP diphosphohydrolase
MESAAARPLNSSNNPRLVFVSHEDLLVSRFRRTIEGCGIEVASLTDVGLPEPGGSARDPLHSATRKAAVVAALTTTPAVSLARGFYIDPLLRWGGGGPQWSWPVPWPHEREILAAELWEAHHALDGMGYCGPDDRGAYFRTVLCLAWPDAESHTFEGRAEGQFGVWGHHHKPGNLVADYFVPDGETVPLASLADQTRQLPPDQDQAFEAFRKALTA